MRRLVVGLLAGIGGLVVLLVLVVGVINFLTTKGGIPDQTIVEADFEQELSEYEAGNPVATLLGERTITVRDVVEALQRAAEDARVVALVARVGRAAMGLAQIQEVRDAVLAFRAAGKRAVAYADSFGEFAPGNGAYYLATAFDTIYLQPSGDVGLTGLIAESPFLRGTLEKLDLVPRLDHRDEYKNFLNLFTERQYTAPHREATRRLMESQFGQIVQGIASARGFTPDTVQALVNQGPFLGAEALQARLVDGLAYRDEVYARVQESTGGQAKLLYLSAYLQRAGRPHTSGPTIALIYGVGGVQRGESGYDPLMRGSTMGAETVTAAFREAVADEAVKAIVFRIDSPGGSYVASDTIWRETVRAREAGKPVIVSMGNVAGSGGYFVAMAADKIVAQPGTITGSIGVIGGKMLTRGLWEKLGLTWDEVHTSTNATLWSSTQDFTPEQWTRLQAWLDRAYEDFTSKVAAGRRLSKEQVLEVAKGRIWTGEDAKASGLVDALGGFPVALRLAREALGLPADARVRLKPIPEPPAPWQALLARLLGEERESSDPRAAVELLARTVRFLQPVLRLAHHLGLERQPGILVMPEVAPAR